MVSVRTARVARTARTVVGLGPLHRVSSEDAKLQRMTIDIEG